MKLLFITEFFPANKKLQFSGGVETRTFYITQGLAKKHNISVICRKTSFLKHNTKFKGINIFPCGLKTKNIEANFFSLFERLIFMVCAFSKALTLKFDLIEGSNFVSYLPAFSAGVFKKKPAVSWWPDVLADNWIKYFGVTGIIGWIFESVSLKLPWVKFIALSKTTQEKLTKRGVMEDKIKEIYGGVKTGRQKEDIKSLEHRKNYILCISRLVEYKRVKDLILAFCRMEKDYAGLNLILIGKGPEKQKLLKLAEQENIFKKVILKKDISQDKLNEYIKYANIFCLPSVLEGFGLVTIEAASWGTPFVIADIEVNREITKGGQGGLLFNKTDIKDLENKLRLLLDNQDLFKKKQKEAISLAENYSWNKIIRKTENIYLKATNE
jgi:glycosyltransferase involved in cell wall biosynthesis